MEHFRFLRIATAAAMVMLLAPSSLRAHQEPTIEEMKIRLANAAVQDRPPLCIRISERQLAAYDRLYVAGDSEGAKAALEDVVAFAEQARDSAIQSRKHEKQCEIAIRKSARKLADIKHTVAHDDQAPVQDAINRLERIRDDLLLAMFPKGGKK